MAFRSELDAARARIEALEERVRELEGPGPAPSVRWRIALSPAAACALLTAVTFGLAMSDKDPPAWTAANLSAVAGVFASLAAWGRAGRPVLGWSLALVKAALPLYMGWGWWALRYKDAITASVEHQALNFFWYVPSLLVLAVLLEGGLLVLALSRHERRG